MDGVWLVATFKSQYNTENETVENIRGCLGHFTGRNCVKNGGQQDSAIHKKATGHMRLGADCDVWREKEYV